MKRHLIFLILFTFHLILAKAQSDTGFSVFYNGYWSEWSVQKVKMKGWYNGFVIYDQFSLDPGDYFFKFQIDGQYKQPKKCDETQIYHGTVEYYISDTHPDIYEVLKLYKCPMVKPSDTYQGNIRKVTAKAEIRIYPYKKHPKLYTFVFNNIGFSIDLCNSGFY